MGRTQKELAQLPHERPKLTNGGDEHWGAKILLKECDYSGKKVEEDSRPYARMRCPRCYLPVAKGQDTYPLHARPVRLLEQAEDRLTKVVKLLGLEPYGDAALKANSRLREMQGTNIDLMVAEVLPLLTSELVKRGAAQEAARAFQDIAALRLGDESERDISDSAHYSEGAQEAPFLSEAYLYPLLGKDAARTLKGHFRRLKDALGA